MCLGARSGDEREGNAKGEGMGYEGEERRIISKSRAKTRGEGEEGRDDKPEGSGGGRGGDQPVTQAGPDEGARGAASLRANGDDNGDGRWRWGG